VAGFHLAAGPGRPPLYGPVDHHPAPARNAQEAPVLCVPVSFAESTGRPSFLAGGGMRKSSTVMERKFLVPGCCQPREANATTEGSAVEIQPPSYPRPRDPYSSPGQKGRAVPDLGSKPWGPGGWIPLCLVSAPGGVSAGALSRGPRGSNFDEPQPRRVKPEDTPSRRALRIHSRTAPAQGPEPTRKCTGAGAHHSIVLSQATFAR